MADCPARVEQLATRPDVTVLCCAFIRFDRNDKPDRNERFLGPKPSPEQIRAFAPALNVTNETPPCFIWQTVEDDAVLVKNALVMADALRRSRVPFDLHMYEKGGHGIGLGTREYVSTKLHPWTQACGFWLRKRGFTRQP